MEKDMLCKPSLPVHLSHRRGAITRRVRRIVVRVGLLVDEISQEGSEGDTELGELPIVDDSLVDGELPA